MSETSVPESDQEKDVHTKVTEDNLDLGHLAKMAATLNIEALDSGDPLPMLWHWAAFNDPLSYSDLGADGYIDTSTIVPDTKGQALMWAGARVDIVHPLLAGKPAQRKTTIGPVVTKQGRNGKLTFVTISSEYSQDFVVCLKEEQDFVLMESVPTMVPQTRQAPEAQWSEEITPDPIILFRYSAVTFNSHRIHYDLDYAQQEGHSGLVVHGPLIATLMCKAFRKANHDKEVTSFSCRALKPLISPNPFVVEGSVIDAQEDGYGTVKLWAAQNGNIAHEAEIKFKV